MATTNHSLPSEADFARLEGELFARIDHRFRRQVLRHRLVAAAAVVVLAGAGVAAGTVANPSQQNRFGYCYAAASTSVAPLTIVLSVHDIQDSSLRPSAAKVGRVVDGCANLWSQGILGSGATSAVPKLQACLRNDLTVAVFPRRHDSASATAFCENLALSAP